MNRRLDTNHLRRCLLMFRALELRNGTRDAAHEQALLRHHRRAHARARWRPGPSSSPRSPFLNRDGRYAFVGGSDDHAGLSIARAYTTFEGECSGAGVRAALRAGADDRGGRARHARGAVAQRVRRHGRLHRPLGAAGLRAPSWTSPAARPRWRRRWPAFGEVLVANGGDLDLGALSRAGHTDAAQGQLYQALETVLVHSGRDALGSLMLAA